MADVIFFGFLAVVGVIAGVTLAYFVRDVLRSAID